MTHYSNIMSHTNNLSFTVILIYELRFIILQHQKLISDTKKNFYDLEENKNFIKQKKLSLER